MDYLVFCDLESEYVSPHLCPLCDNKLSFCSNAKDDIEVNEPGKALRKQKRRINGWKSKEDNLVISLYPRSEKEDILKAIPNRSWGAIQNRATYLKVRRVVKNTLRHDSWKLEDEEFLKKNYYWASDERLKKRLKRSKVAIKCRANKMGLKRAPYFVRLNIMKNQKK